MDNSEIITNFDIKQYLDDKDIEYRTKGKNVSSGWTEINCVFPDCSDGSFHLGINNKSGLYKCWICSAKGNVIKLVMQIEICSYKQAINIIKKYPKDIYLQNEEPERKLIDKRDFSLPKEIQLEWPIEHLTYLIDRNFEFEDIIKKYRLKPVYNFGKYRYRIIAPIFLDRKIVSYQAMDVLKTDNRPPYLPCPISESIIPVNHCLYNIDTVINKVIITEGITDVWRLGDKAVATFTSNFTSEQIALLIRKKVKEAYILYDADANKKGKALANQLSGIIKKVKLIGLEKGDPADLSDQDAGKLKRDLLDE